MFPTLDLAVGPKHSSTISSSLCMRGREGGREGGREERVKDVGRREVREERESSSCRKPFAVHSLNSVLWKREVPGPSDVVCSEVADDRVTTQQLARGDQTEHDDSSSLIPRPQVGSLPPCGTSMRSQWFMQ